MIRGTVRVIVFRRLVSINLVWKSFTYAYSNLDLLQVDSNVEKNSKSGTANTSSRARARAPLVALGSSCTPYRFSSFFTTFELICTKSNLNSNGKHSKIER